MTLEDKIQESYPESYPLRTGKLTGEYRSLFLSDIHLATKSCKARHLNKFLKQAEGKFEEVYIIGDFIDMINFRHKLYFDSHHMDVLRRLLFKIPKEGAKVRYIPGNHDLYFRPFIEDNPGEFGDVDIINSYDYRSMDGKRYKITHGDEFDVFMKPEFFWLSRLGNAAYDVMVLANQALNWTREKLGLSYWSLAQYAKKKSKKLVIDRYETALVEVAKKEQYDGVICGHIHQAANRQLNGIHYLNTGDWVDSCTALVETKEGEFIHYDWHHKLNEKDLSTED